MTAFCRLRTNRALNRQTTLFAALVRYSAKERRQPMRHGSLQTGPGALQFGWRRRTLRRDCWENAHIALRYSAWAKCKRRAVLVRQAPEYYIPGLAGLALYRMMHNSADSWNTVYRTRPYRLHRFMRSAQL